jgi:hypothetical protein
MKELTEKDYKKYMKVVDDYIKNAEIWINKIIGTQMSQDIDNQTLANIKAGALVNYKKLRQLSFEDWVKFQNGELKISKI